ncbi:hypothetical protein E4U54_001872 [Claviceps lovelessii]|nr:hypothetical protein E4U54_001872 [Claviceps lovelessii]
MIMNIIQPVSVPPKRPRCLHQREAKLMGVVVPEQAWERLRQDLCDRVQEGLRFYTRQDLLPFHDLHVIDDPDLYRATSHQVRGHFLSLVPEHLKARVRPGATNLQNDQDWTYAKFHAQI